MAIAIVVFVYLKKLTADKREWEAQKKRDEYTIQQADAMLRYYEQERLKQSEDKRE